MKRFLSVLLMVAMLLTVCSVGVFANDAAPEGEAIRSAAGLSRMEVDGTYYLANDIVIHGSWEFAVFRGTLDGNGHTIYFDHATVAGGLFAQLGGAEGVFVGSGIFRSGDPVKRAAAIVRAVANWQDPEILAQVSTGLGKAMVGINADEIKIIMAERGI